MIIVGMLNTQEEAEELKRIIKYVVTGERSRYLGQQARKIKEENDKVDKVVEEMENANKQKAS